MPKTRREVRPHDEEDRMAAVCLCSRATNNAMCSDAQDALSPPYLSLQHPVFYLSTPPLNALPRPFLRPSLASLPKRPPPHTTCRVRRCLLCTIQKQSTVILLQREEGSRCRLCAWVW